MATSDCAPGLGLELGYARVSTSEQDTSVQIAALSAAGVVAYWDEQRSGVKDRPALEELLSFLRPGDVLVFYKLDRLARSLTDLMRIETRVREAGATLRSLNEPIETVSPVGRFMFQILGAVAELERNVIRQRCADGVAEAMKRGVKFGRKRTKFSYTEAFRMRKQGKTFGEIARELGALRSHVFMACRTVQRELDSGRLTIGGLGEESPSLCPEPGQPS